MKQILSMLISCFIFTQLLAQTFSIKLNNADSKAVTIDQNKMTEGIGVPVDSLFITCTSEGQDEAMFSLFVDKNKCIDFKGIDGKKGLICSGITDMRDKKIEITDKDNKSLLVFTIPSTILFSVKIKKNDPPLSFNTNGEIQEKLTDKVPSLFITCTSPGQDSVDFKFYVAGKEVGGFKGADKDKELASPNFADLRGQTIQIRDGSGKTKFLTFKIISSSQASNIRNGNGTDTNNAPKNGKTTVIDTISNMFPSMVVTQYGLQIPVGNRNTIYTGDKYVHIFLDQYGNNIFTTIPQGISNRQYVVHIYYQQDADHPNDVIYSINQLEGEFQDALVFNNAGQLGNFALHFGEDIIYQWEYKEYLLSTSTTDIKFEIVRTSPKAENSKEVDNTVLKTYTIKMSKVFHGTFDVGLINSTMGNPNFELLASATDPNLKVVKKSAGGNRGVVTAMATFYSSPIIILESLFGRKQIPPYKLTGRNFLDDHKIYERIYPTVGVGFIDKTLENLFFGFNWEFARGGAIFVGWHYGKVNTYETSNGFVFEQTQVTDAEFALKQGSAWKTGFAIGLKLDIMIVKNLFGSAATGTPAGN
jgi:hypothetical protein